MKRSASMPEARLLIPNNFPIRVSREINDLVRLDEHKVTESPPPSVRKLSDDTDNDGTEPTLEDDYGFFPIDEEMDNSICSGMLHDDAGSISNSEHSTEQLSSSYGSIPTRLRSSRKKSALRRGSAYGTVDNIPLDFERKEFNRVLPKPNLSQRTTLSTSQPKGMSRSRSRGLFRVSSEPVFARPVYQEELYDNDQDLSSHSGVARSEHSESSFVEGAMKKRISFGTIKIREHGQTIGDNPSCSYGAPISLDWDHRDMEELKVDDYEAYRPDARTKEKFHLNHFQRSNLLKLNGHSNDEIKESKKQTRKLRNQRERTKFVAMNYPKVGTVEDVIESGLRKVKRSISKSKIHGSMIPRESLPRKSSEDDLNVPVYPKALLLEMMDNDESNATAPF